MTLAATTWSSPPSLAGNGNSVSPSTSLEARAIRGFLELDDRVANGGAGAILARAPSRDAALAIAAHVVRRVEANGQVGILAFARDGAPLWTEFAALLGASTLSCVPARCAEEIAQ